MIHYGIYIENDYKKNKITQAIEGNCQIVLEIHRQFINGDILTNIIYPRQVKTGMRGININRSEIVEIETVIQKIKLPFN